MSFFGCGWFDIIDIVLYAEWNRPSTITAIFPFNNRFIKIWFSDLLNIVLKDHILKCLRFFVPLNQCRRLLLENKINLEGHLLTPLPDTSRSMIVLMYSALGFPYHVSCYFCGHYILCTYTFISYLRNISIRWKQYTCSRFVAATIIQREKSNRTTSATIIYDIVLPSLGAVRRQFNHPHLFFIIMRFM